MTTALPTTALWIEAATRLISSCSFAGSRSSSAFHHSSKCYLPLQTIGNVITAKSALRPPQTPILARSAFGPRTPMVAKCTVNGHENSPRTATEFPRYGHFISPDMASKSPHGRQRNSPVWLGQEHHPLSRDGIYKAHLIPPSPPNSPLLHHPPDSMSRTVGCVNR